MGRSPGNNYVIVIFDSCRFDSFTAAAPKVMSKLGKVEKRFSYASWTAPSHFNLLSGLLPHSSPKGVFASEYYKKDFVKYSERLGVEGISFKLPVPKLYFPDFLRDSLGYRTNAMVSMPVLNPKTILNHGFDTYRLMERPARPTSRSHPPPQPDARPSAAKASASTRRCPHALRRGQVVRRKLRSAAGAHVLDAVIMPDGPRPRSPARFRRRCGSDQISHCCR